MAYTYLKDGALVEQQVGLVGCDAAFMDAFQAQVAAALKTQWITIPLSAGWAAGNTSGVKWPSDITAGTMWNLVLDDRGDSTNVRHWRVAAATGQYLAFNLSGHPMFRHGCVITAVRTKTGGGVNGGDCKLLKSKVFTASGTVPATEETVAAVFEAADNKFNGTGLLVEKTLSTPDTINEDYTYELLFTSGSGTCMVFGVQVLVEYPTA